MIKNKSLLFGRLFTVTLFIPMVLGVSFLPVKSNASINSWYDGDVDNVLDSNDVNGWADQSGQVYGGNVAGGRAYRFGPRINFYGTWGQLIYSQPSDLAGSDLGDPSGLNGYMPPNPTPDNGTWVQGHLVNGECGGYGTLANNLTPISKAMNNRHKGYEAIVQRLVNRGIAAGTSLKFNPHNIPNSRLIYRTHALPPQPGSTEPSGLVVSLGIVINGQMMSEIQLSQHFSQAQGTDRWFGDSYYGSGALKNDRSKMIEMLGGVEV